MANTNPNTKKSRVTMSSSDDKLLPSLSPSVEDDIVIGTSKILQSPHVSEGPGRVANAPVPSVYCDDRGEIHRLRVGGKRLNLLFSKKDTMRSGYLHPNNFHDFVVSGKVEVWTLTTDNTQKDIHGPGDHVCIRPFTPHILHFLEDTVLMEWWEPGPFQCWYYHPYRRIVDVQNSLVSSTTGIFQKLVPQDDSVVGASSRAASMLRGFFWLSTGLVCGIALGTKMSSKRR